MKNIILILILTGSTQVALCQTLELPFTKLTDQYKLIAEINTPALVTEKKFREAIKEDCTEYRNQYNKYQDVLSKEDVSDMLRLPLAYVMKENYQVELIIKIPVLLNAQVSFSNTESIKKITVINIDKDAMLFKSTLRGLVTHQTDFKVIDSVVTITRRDIVCDLLDQKAQIEMMLELDITPDMVMRNLVNTVTGGWVKSVQQVVANEVDIKRQAAWLGFHFTDTVKPFEQQVDSSFLNLEYFFSTYFEDNSLQIKVNWFTPLSKLTVVKSLPVELNL